MSVWERESRHAKTEMKIGIKKDISRERLSQVEVVLLHQQCFINGVNVFHSHHRNFISSCMDKI